MLTVETLNRITGSTAMADRKAALVRRLADMGGPLNQPHVLAQFLAQVLHESGGLRYVREVWGPTKAQSGYEGRGDLGNVRPGDGKRFMGRDLIQVTGRANHRALTHWLWRIDPAAPDFEVRPEALESPEWLGIGAVWYFLTRPKLMAYAEAGNIEMVTRTVNGGLNGYADRLRWYDRTALSLIGVGSIREFQGEAGLLVDGISGPLTRAALHARLRSLSGPVAAPVAPTAPVQAPAQPRAVPDFPAAAPAMPAWLVALWRRWVG